MCSASWLIWFGLSVPVQMIDWKDSTPKWPIMCCYWWGRHTLLTHSLFVGRPSGGLNKWAKLKKTKVVIAAVI